MSTNFDYNNYVKSYRILHELSHALTMPEVNSIYGEGKRTGKLGTDLTLNEAMRAVHWEWLAAHKQRELSKQIGVHLSDEDFHRELNSVMHDAIHRAVTGKFTDPSQEGFVPHARPIELSHALDTIRSEAEYLSKVKKNSVLGIRERALKKAHNKYRQINEAGFVSDDPTYNDHQVLDTALREQGFQDSPLRDSNDSKFLNTDLLARTYHNKPAGGLGSRHLRDLRDRHLPAEDYGSRFSRDPQDNVPMSQLEGSVVGQNHFKGIEPRYGETTEHPSFGADDWKSVGEDLPEAPKLGVPTPDRNAMSEKTLAALRRRASLQKAEAMQKTWPKNPDGTLDVTGQSPENKQNEFGFGFGKQASKPVQAVVQDINLEGGVQRTTIGPKAIQEKLRLALRGRGYPWEKKFVPGIARNPGGVRFTQSGTPVPYTVDEEAQARIEEARMAQIEKHPRPRMPDPGYYLDGDTQGYDISPFTSTYDTSGFSRDYDHEFWADAQRWTEHEGRQNLNPSPAAKMPTKTEMESAWERSPVFNKKK